MVGCLLLGIAAAAGPGQASGRVAPALPGTPLRQLAAARGLRLFGTDVVDTWPQPFKTDAEYTALARAEFNFANWDWCTCWATNQPAGAGQPYDFTCFDAAAEWMRAGNMSARTNGIVVSAHNLLPPISTDLPKWLTAGFQAGRISPGQARASSDAAFAHPC